MLINDEERIVLCDFGLSRHMKAGQYYRQKTDTDVPWLWMSPEAFGKGVGDKFTVKTDVLMRVACLRCVFVRVPVRD
jgi:hypothetical protein